MPEFGLLPEGLSVPTYDEIVDGVVAELRPLWGDSFDFSDGGQIGQLIRSEARVANTVWQAVQAVYASRTREGASGEALAANLALTGTEWPAALPSAVVLTLTGGAGGAIPSGSIARDPVTLTQFKTVDDAELVGADPVALSTAYDVGERVTGDDGVYQVSIAGVTPASGTLAGTGTVVFGATFRFLGEGDAAGDALAQSIDTGPIVAVSGSITEIVTPSGTWQGVINLLDATIGRDEATDGEARLAGEADVYRPASTTPDAVRQNLLRFATIVDVIVNDTDVTVDGVGPHGVEAVVTGGDDQDIADLLLRECIAAGITTYGSTAVVSYDVEGKPHTMRFTRVTDVLISVAITVEKLPYVAADPNTYPADGNEQVKLAIVTWGNALRGGVDIRARAVAARAFEVTGVLDTPVCNISISPTAPTAATTIVLTRRQRGLFDTSRIAVTGTDGTV